MIDWQRSGPPGAGGYRDIIYETAEGIAKITINRPRARNAYRPTTLFELSAAFTAARDDPSVGAIILTGAGGAPDARPRQRAPELARLPRRP